MLTARIIISLAWHVALPVTLCSLVIFAGDWFLGERGSGVLPSLPVALLVSLLASLLVCLIIGAVTTLLMLNRLKKKGMTLESYLSHSPEDQERIMKGE